MAAKKKKAKNGRKKPRTAKQKRADKKNGARLARMNRSKGPKARKSPTKAPKRKANKQKKASKKQMAGKKKGILSNIPLINNPTFKKAAVGVGTATIGVAVLNLVAPSIANQPLVRPVLAFAGGGIPGVIAQLVSQGGISALGIGGGGSQTVNTAGNGGFA